LSRGIHEPDASPRSDDRVERAADQLATLWIEQERPLIHAVVTDPALKIVVVSALLLAPGEACSVEAVTGGARFAAQFVEADRWHPADEVLTLGQQVGSRWPSRNPGAARARCNQHPERSVELSLRTARRCTAPWTDGVL